MKLVTSPGPATAIGAGTIIGSLGGLIGLGGGEFRLPVLTGIFGYAARAAVPLNLVVSFVTLAASLAIRSQTLSLSAVVPHAAEVVALGFGGMIGARWSATLLTRLSDHMLETAVALLLAGIGLLLIVEAFLPIGAASLIPREALWLGLSGVVLGVVIGTVAALLGVAGGELLIPTLLYLFGADIRTAGTASLMISIVTVASGLWRYRSLGALPDRDAMMRIGMPMALGSILGAVGGGLLVSIVSVSLLKMVLGTALIAASCRGILKRTRKAWFGK